MKMELTPGYNVNKEIMEQVLKMSGKLVRDYSFSVGVAVDDGVLFESSFKCFVSKEDIEELGELLSKKFLKDGNNG